MKPDINKISDIDFKNPFIVPEGYFEGINDEVMSRLPKKKVIKPIKISMWARVKPWVYMAAMFVGTFFFIKLIFNNTTDNQEGSLARTITNQYAFSEDKYWSNIQISEDDFYEYLEDQLVSDGYYDYMYNQVSF